MKIKLLTITILLVSNLLNAQMPKIEWARVIGGTGNERANSIETDAEGNIILAGRFQSSSIVSGNLTLKKNASDNENIADIFIIKLDKNGKEIWAVTAGNSGDDHAIDCIADAAGNVYAVGWFESETISFGDVSLRNNNFTFGKDSVRYNCDMWVAKFSPAGKCIWARNAGGLDGNGQYSTIALDKDNNVVIGGIAGARMDFGNGVILSNEKGGMFVAKYSGEGRLLWAKGSANGECHGIGVDEKNNIYAGGYFSNQTSFDGITLSSNGKTDAYIVKYSPEGKAVWAKSFGGEGGEIASCETDPFGNVYLAGLYFSKSITSGNSTLTNNGSINAFIAKFDQDGNLLWANSAGGNNGDGPATATREFHLDKKGNAYCTGSNWSAFSFAGNQIKTVSGSEDILLLKYDKEGKEIWGLDYGGSGRNAGRGVTTDGNGHILLTGSFDEKELKIEDQVLTNKGSSDIFLVKFSEMKK